MPAPDKIKELVDRFHFNIEEYKKNYNETQVRREFIDPLFEALGWDMINNQGFSEAYKDVIHEDAIKIEGKTKAPDYSFRIGGVRKFFLEAKKPSVNIKEDIHPAFQLRRYGWSANLPISILTDFEEFAVYDCTVKPNQNDKADCSRIIYYKYTEFIDKWDELLQFSPDGIQKGIFDKYIKKGKKGTTTVDNAFLKEIERWRELLARNIALRNPNLTQRELNFSVQQTIDRIIFLRICEDRGIEEYETLQKIKTGDNTYKRLFKLFQKADIRYNSGLFHFKKEKGREGFDQLSQDLIIDDTPLKDIFKNLYYPDSSYEFSVFPSDILGQIYEKFLGKTISLTAGHHARIEDKPEVRKAGGVYYTPTYIVDYIVKNTIGKLVESKSINVVNKLKVLDPACGSGSFLLGVYQFLLNWYLNKYNQNPKKYIKQKKPPIYQTSIKEWKLTIEEKKRILLNNIYGVDIDSYAVEVTKLSLLLKVLEGESEQTIGKTMKLFQERVLPDLSKNIKCGNSLIGSDFYKDQQMDMFKEKEIFKINAFDWDIEFKDIIDNGGFDAIIGNPPWGASLSEKDKKYLAQKYLGFSGNYDSYLFFIEKIVNLINKKGLFSFITPDTWISIPQANKFRKIVLNNCFVNQITTLPPNVFKNVGANYITFVISSNKIKKNKDCKVNIIKKIDSNLSYLDKNNFTDSYVVNSSNWNNGEDNQFQIYQKQKIETIIEKIKKISLPAKFFLDVSQGIIPYSREKQTDYIVKNRGFHATTKLSEDYGVWVQGRSISRYKLQIRKKEYLKYGAWLGRSRKKKYFEGTRILIQEITDPEISACYYNKQLYHDPGIISCLNSDNEIDILFLLAIINSFLINWYHKCASPKGNRIRFPKLLISDVRKLPIPKLDLTNLKDKKNHNKIVSLVTQIIDLKKKLTEANIPQVSKMLERQIESTDKQIDKIVYKLYGLEEPEIKIIEES